MPLLASLLLLLLNKIINILGMMVPSIIALSPDKANMSYWVNERVSVEETFAPLAAKMQKERTEMQRVIIFCRRCASIYDFSCPH